MKSLTKQFVGEVKLKPEKESGYRIGVIIGFRGSFNDQTMKSRERIETKENKEIIETIE